MKLSKYSFIIRKEKIIFLYNCWTEKITVIQSELAALLYKDKINDIKKKHPTFYEHLLTERYIVDDGVIEEEQVIKQWESEETNATSFTIFVNPTLNCNMRCWYCYEEHRSKAVMTQEILNSIIKLLENKISENKLVQINLSFFGGEPLLEFDTIVMPLIYKIEQLCEIHKIGLNVGFVTNGILLNSKKIEKLSKIKTTTPIGFQITIDGDERYHNATKKEENNKNSYRITLSNIKTLIRNKIFVTIRFNTTHYNISSYQNVISEFDDLSEEERSFIKFDIQHVWQDSNYDRKDFDKKQIELRETLLKKGHNVSSLKHIDSSRCYADRKNCIVINYNGDLYKCTARDFISSNKEGIITKDGKLFWNEKYEKRNQIKYGSKTCQICHIYPLCHGGCSQSKLEQEKTTGCMKGYNHNDKIKIIEDRLDFLLESIIKQNEIKDEQRN